MKRAYFLMGVLQLQGEKDEDEASRVMLKMIDANYQREDAMSRRMSVLEKRSRRGVVRSGKDELFRGLLDVYFQNSADVQIGVSEDESCEMCIQSTPAVETSMEGFCF